MYTDNRNNWKEALANDIANVDAQIAAMTDEEVSELLKKFEEERGS